MKCILIFWLLFFSSAAAAEPAPATIDVVIADDGIASVKCTAAPVSEVFREISDTCGVAIEWVDSLGSLPVTYSGRGPVADVVIGLVRRIGIASYSLEYQEDRLLKIRVFSHSESEVNSPLPDGDDPAGVDDRYLEGARVVGLAENAQARHLDLLPGDLILTYDGVRVTSTGDLIRSVSKTSPADRVEMLVVRDRLPIRIYLTGGFIGVRIKNAMVENKGMDKYLPD